MTPSILLWFAVLIIGGVISGIIKTILGIKVYSSVKYGVIIYSVIDTILGVANVYTLWSVMAGHWLK